MEFIRPSFIVFEGTEGAGKTTLLNLLKEKLTIRRQDNTVLSEPTYVREPGTGDVGQAIRQVLLGAHGSSLSVTTNALLFAAAYRNTIHQYILPALRNNQFVLSDRTNISCRVYQAESDYIHTLCDMNDKLCRPDIVFIMVTEHEVVERRMKQRASADINWRDFVGKDFHDRLKQGYLDYASERPDLCVILDTSKTPEQLLDDVLYHLRERFGYDPCGDNLLGG